MEQFLGRYTEQLYALLRISVGLLFLFHGLQKLVGWPVELGRPLEGLILVAGVIELVGGALVALGLFTGWAAFLCSGQMAVAYFLVHQGQGLFPIENRGELAALYAWVFLFLASKGSGRISLDRARGAA